MKGWFRITTTRVLAIVGVLVIALALALGALRLVIAQLPGYQDELKAWVTAELGVEARFAGLDTRLGLRGPELDLRGVRLRAVGADRPFLDARSASLTVDPWALVKGQVALSRLTVEGARLGIERTSDGELRVQGLQPEDGAAPDFVSLIPESIDVVIRDSELIYSDRPQGRSWQFADLELALVRGPTGLDAEARATPQAGIGERLNVSVEQAITSGDVSVRVELEDADMAALSRLVPAELETGLQGRGDLDLVVHWTAGVIEELRAEVALADVGLGEIDDAYEEVGFSAGWSRLDESGFLLEFDDMVLARAGQAWPGGGQASIRTSGRRTTVTADFIRLEDLWPAIDAAAAAEWVSAEVVDRWTALDLQGDVSELSVVVDDGGADVVEFSGQFSDLTVAPQENIPGFRGLSGQIRSGAGGGTLQLTSTAAELHWPAFIDAVVGGGELAGTIVWRRGQDGVRVLGDDLRFDVFGEPLSASVEISIPEDSEVPYLDLHAQIGSVDISDAKTLLPESLLPPSVSRWLQAALQGGTIEATEVEFTGGLSDFPFDDGSGQLRIVADVDNAVIEFINDWPRAEALTGQIEFINAGFSAAGSGSVLGSRSEDMRVAIADMRAPLFELNATVAGPLSNTLEFVQTAPLISRHLGTGFDRLNALQGAAATALDLELPLLDFASYALEGRIAIADGELSLTGFGPEATEVNGVLEISNSSVSATDINAVFLGGPATASVMPSSEPGYRTTLEVAGETTPEFVFSAFSLPLREMVEGQTLWSGRLMLPRTESSEPGPLRIEIESNLSGVALAFPPPLAKPPGEPVNLRLAFEVDGSRALVIDGNLGASRRFDFRLDRRDDRFALSRGALAFGGDDPVLPLRDGIVVHGRVPSLQLDQWLSLGRSANVQQARPLFYSADLEIGEFGAFGQQLGTTTLAVGRGDRVWDIEIESGAIAGRVEVPQALRSRSPIIADMDRVYLELGDSSLDATGLDPREMPGLRLRANEFGFGPRELGQVEADVVPEADGLRLASLTSTTQNFTMTASGSWLGSADASESRFSASVSSQAVSSTLQQLGIDPVVEGESGELTAQIDWQGPPSARWLDHVNGEVALRINTGSLVEVDPGAGRVVGLMSIAALPRRLLLDFRDVFNKGFSFDEITGSFVLEDGDAYTDNLKLSGPAAEIGVIGRTGLRDRDYQQQAVVTAEPGNVLPTVGGLLGGPGVGAALLLFTRIFKEPLKGIGRAAYCVTGSWDAPEVERMDQDGEEVNSCIAMPAWMVEPVDGG